jgi:hypothetical protein
VDAGHHSTEQLVVVVKAQSSARPTDQPRYCLETRKVDGDRVPVGVLVSDRLGSRMTRRAVPFEALKDRAVFFLHFL